MENSNTWPTNVISNTDTDSDTVVFTHARHHKKTRSGHHKHDTHLDNSQHLKPVVNVSRLKQQYIDQYRRQQPQSLMRPSKHRDHLHRSQSYPHGSSHHPHRSQSHPVHQKSPKQHGHSRHKKTTFAD